MNAVGHQLGELYQTMSIKRHIPYLRVAMMAVLAITLVGHAGSMAWAQAKRPVKKPPRPPAKKEKKTKPEDLTLVTKDGVFLRCTYYAGPESKTTVPLILLHDWDGNRRELQPLALYLQDAKHSVIVPDLRGHGRSMLARNPRPGGPELEIDRDKMKGPAVKAMLEDVETAKRFLMARNNEGKLNIEQLGVLGTGFGATLALNWAVWDWSVNSLPTYKMGQDVKALILISPLQSFKGLTTRLALAKSNDVALRRMSALVVVGEADIRSYSDAKRIYKAFERCHLNSAEKDLMLYSPDTSLQGVRLINARGLKVPQWIRGFVEQRLARKASRFIWQDRTSPLK